MYTFHVNLQTYHCEWKNSTTQPPAANLMLLPPTQKDKLVSIQEQLIDGGTVKPPKMPITHLIAPPTFIFPEIPCTSAKACDVNHTTWSCPSSLQFRLPQQKNLELQGPITILLLNENYKHFSTACNLNA